MQQIPVTESLEWVEPGTGRMQKITPEPPAENNVQSVGLAGNLPVIMEARNSGSRRARK